ncbi:MAG TPA: adenylate/guanylate cyclase domain-containing protein [Candidatus Limnocylindria bacterium]|nr:adenylate/guanylate cyclase domain-containing protein [Candidatus Limnocylindria bacterium]
MTTAAPTPLAQKMRAAGPGERKPVSAVLADVVNSTVLTASMDPEDWIEIINDAFSRMSQVIYRYEGTIARLMGDGILAFFGAPVAHEDDPERAVRCALDMIATIDDLGTELRRARGIEFGIRVGVNTGLVVVGTVGSDLMYEYTAMGDAVNVAARMESAARPGTVLVTETTFRFIAPLFDAVELEPLSVKGKSEPVVAFEIIGPKHAPGRTRGIVGLGSAMVGREKELATLDELVAVVRAGRGRAACVIGEPGLGKTRLIGELRPRATGAGVVWAEGRCVSYGRSLPYHLVGRLVRSLIGVGPTADDAETRGALEARIGELLGADSPNAILYLGHLLGLELTREDLERVTSIDPVFLQGRYAQTMRQVIRATTAHAPLALVCDDVHWADSASVELLADLMALANELPLLVLVACRPEQDAAGWRLVTMARDLFADVLAEIRLQPLSAEESRALIGNLLDVTSLPAHVRTFILQRAEGNPFFVEEIIRMLIDRGALAPSAAGWAATKGIEAVEIPDTIQGLLLARIDRLADEPKRVLRVASVMGRRFSLPLLERMMTSEHPTAIAPQIGALEAAGLVRIAAVEPAVEYLFRHILVQEAAYGSLLKQERRRLHAAVADALEAMHPEHPASLAPVLARHLDEAGEGARAVPYLLEAGRAAAVGFAIHEARAAYERALIHLEALEVTPERRRQRVEAVIGAVKVGWNFKPWDEEVASVERVLPLAEELGDLRLLAEAHFWIAYLRRALGDTEATSPALKRSLERSAEIGQELGDESIGAMPQTFAALGMLFAGQIRPAIGMLDRLFPVYRKRGDPIGAALIAGMRSMAYARVGDFAAAERAATESDAIARTADLMAILDAQAGHAYIDLERGELDRAADTAQACRVQADEAGALSCSVLSNYLLGVADILRAQPSAARSAFERARDVAQAASAAPWRNRVLGGLSWSRAMLGDAGADALADLDRALETAHQMRDPYDEGTLLMLRGTIRARSEQTRTAAYTDFAAAKELFTAIGARPAIVRTLRAWAGALEGAGRGSEAAERQSEADILAAQLGIANKA